MIRLVVVFLVACLGWMIWWAVGQGTYEQGLAAWIKDRRADGWVAEYSELGTSGFPNRFDTTISDVALSDPVSGLAWTGPFVQFLSLSYKPHQVIAVLPNRHSFSMPRETFAIEHKDARASLFLNPAPSLALDRVRFVVEDATIASSLGWEMSVAEGRFAASAQLETAANYRIGTEILALDLASPLLRSLDPENRMPSVVDSIRLDALVGFSRPWDRYAIEAAVPQVTSIDLSDLSVRWGDMSIRFAGNVTLDAAGIPEGQIDVTAVQWRQILDMAIAGGAIPEDMRKPAENALALISAQSDTVEASLNISDGWIRLGPVALAPVPSLF